MQGSWYYDRNRSQDHGAFTRRESSSSGQQKHSKELELFIKFRSFKPYLKGRLEKIYREGNERSCREEVDDIQYFLNVMGDMMADENHGAEALQSFIDRIYEMVRMHPESTPSRPENPVIEEDSEDAPRSPSPVNYLMEDTPLPRTIPLEAPIPASGATDLHSTFNHRSGSQWHDKSYGLPDPFRPGTQDVDMRSMNFRGGTDMSALANNPVWGGQRHNNNARLEENNGYSSRAHGDSWDRRSRSSLDYSRPREREQDYYEERRRPPTEDYEPWRQSRDVRQERQWNRETPAERQEPEYERRDPRERYYHEHQLPAHPPSQHSRSSDYLHHERRERDRDGYYRDYNYRDPDHRRQYVDHGSYDRSLRSPAPPPTDSLFERRQRPSGDSSFEYERRPASNSIPSERQYRYDYNSSVSSDWSSGSRDKDMRSSYPSATPNVPPPPANIHKPSYPYHAENSSRKSFDSSDDSYYATYRDSPISPEPNANDPRLIPNRVTNPQAIPPESPEVNDRDRVQPHPSVPRRDPYPSAPYGYRSGRNLRSPPPPIPPHPSGPNPFANPLSMTNPFMQTQPHYPTQSSDIREISKQKAQQCFARNSNFRSQNLSRHNSSSTLPPAPPRPNNVTASTNFSPGSGEASNSNKNLPSSTANTAATLPSAPTHVSQSQNVGHKPQITPEYLLSNQMLSERDPRLPRLLKKLNATVPSQLYPLSKTNREPVTVDPPPQPRSSHKPTAESEKPQRPSDQAPKAKTSKPAKTTTEAAEVTSDEPAKSSKPPEVEPKEKAADEIEPVSESSQEQETPEVENVEEDKDKTESHTGRSRSLTRKRSSKRRSSLEKLHDALKEMSFDKMLPLGPRRCTRGQEGEEGSTDASVADPCSQASDSGLDAVSSGSITTSGAEASQASTISDNITETETVTPSSEPVSAASVSAGAKRGRKRKRKGGKRLSPVKRKRGPVTRAQSAVKTPTSVENSNGESNSPEKPPSPKKKPAKKRSPKNTSHTEIRITRSSTGKSVMVNNIGLEKIKLEADYIPPPKTEPVDTSDDFCVSAGTGLEHLNPEFSNIDEEKTESVAENVAPSVTIKMTMPSFDDDEDDQDDVVEVDKDGNMFSSVVSNEPEEMQPEWEWPDPPKIDSTYSAEPAAEEDEFDELYARVGMEEDEDDEDSCSNMENGNEAHNENALLLDIKPAIPRIPLVEKPAEKAFEEVPDKNEHWSVIDIDNILAGSKETLKILNECENLMDGEESEEPNDWLDLGTPSSYSCDSPYTEEEESQPTDLPPEPDLKIVKTESTAVDAAVASASSAPVCVQNDGTLSSVDKKKSTTVMECNNSVTDDDDDIQVVAVFNSSGVQIIDDSPVKSVKVEGDTVPENDRDPLGETLSENIPKGDPLSQGSYASDTSVVINKENISRSIQDLCADEKELLEESRQIESLMDEQRTKNLCGHELYRCANFPCGVSTSSAAGFKDHVVVCNSCDFKALNCFHCDKRLKSIGNLLEHTKTHGLPKQFCSLCSFKAWISPELTRHMKAYHKVYNYKMEKYMVAGEEDPVFVMWPKDILSKIYNLDEFRRAYATYANKVVYSPSDINIIPRRYIFSYGLHCSLCSYVTKVRVNMIRHLACHLMPDENSKWDASQPVMTDPINPVPCLERKELMFDKMTNWAGSSHAHKSNTVENNAGLPQFVAEQFRYVCSVCEQITVNENMLKAHIKTLHPKEEVYKCPHCDKSENFRMDPRNTVIIEKLGFHLKLHGPKLYRCAYCDMLHTNVSQMEKHLPEKHPEKKPIHYLVRNLDQDGNNPNRRSSMEEEVSSERWKCALCSYKNIFNSYPAVKQHCSMVHHIDNQLFCYGCKYGSDKNTDILSHFDRDKCSAKPPGTGARECILIFWYRHDGDQQKPEQVIRPLWKKSVGVKHIRGIFLEEKSGKLTDYDSKRIYKY